MTSWFKANDSWFKANNSWFNANNSWFKANRRFWPLTTNFWLALNHEYSWFKASSFVVQSQFVRGSRPGRVQ